jgi:hypothetical protein
MRIHENLNPRYKKREDTMRNDRYQEPDYGRVRTQLDKQVSQPQYQPQYQPQPQPQYQPPQQQAYNPNYYPPQQQMPYQQPQHSVAPVNRAGYNNNFMSDPNNIQLDSLQQDVANMFENPFNDLSQAVYNRPMNREEVHNTYKQGLVKQYNQGR